AHQMGTAATRFEKKVTGLEDLIRELRSGRFRAEELAQQETAANSGSGT
ncbi:MAG: hypothetical protein IIC96_17605, partial [Chloroflexi bacterium]|nr:hypothetical protein [Chloroflexota bacterium]